MALATVLRPSSMEEACAVLCHLSENDALAHELGLDKVRRHEE